MPSAMAFLISRISAAVSHQGCWKWYPATKIMASRKPHTNRREVHLLVANVKSIARAAFKHSNQRKGSCTKRNFGKCCHNKLVTENISTALPAPQIDKSIQGLRS